MGKLKPGLAKWMKAHPKKAAANKAKVTGKKVKKRSVKDTTPDKTESAMRKAFEKRMKMKS